MGRALEFRTLQCCLHLNDQVCTSQVGLIEKEKRLTLRRENKEATYVVGAASKLEQSIYIFFCVCFYYKVRCIGMETCNNSNFLYRMNLVLAIFLYPV